MSTGVDAVLTLASYDQLGLGLPPDMPYDDWAAVGAALGHMEANVMWWLGDWWRYGEHHYGERAAQVAPTGYAMQTVLDAARVATRFPEVAGRHATVPWSHHREVAALPEEQAEALLEEVETTVAEGGKPMPREQLRAKVRHLRAAEEAPPEAYSWQAACFTCNQPGPHLDCQPGHMTVDRGALCQWLGDHQHGHDVRLLGEEQVAEWRARV